MMVANREPVLRTRKPRSRLKIGVSIFAIGVLSLAVHCVLIEPRQLEFTKIDVPVKGLPKAFDGLKIVQLTDTHIGLYARPRGLADLVRRVNDLHPDIVVLTGDIVSIGKRNIDPTAEALSGLKAKYGVYAVLGNHDYWVDGPHMTSALKRDGFDVLVNENREIKADGERLWLVGLDDLWEGKHNYARGFDGIKPGEPCVVLAHNPDTVLKLKGRHIDLMMTGHTHGGLINLPHFGPLFSVTKLGPKYSAGMFRFGDIHMYVCRGAGSGAPVRFRCRPEVPTFILRSVHVSPQP